MVKKHYSDSELLWQILHRARPYWLQIVGIFLIGLLSVPLTLLTPLPLKIAVDSILGSEPLPDFLNLLLPSGLSDGILLALTAGMILAIALLSQLQDMGSSLLRTYTGEKLNLDFRAQLFQHAQRLSLSYHDKKGIADSVYRIHYDTSASQYIAIDGMIPLVTAMITLASMLYVMFRLDWQLAMVALSVSPVLFMVARFNRLQLRRKSRQTKELESATFSVVQEVLASLRVVKAFGQEDREQERFVHRSNETLGARIRLTIAEGGVGLAIGLTIALGTAIVLFVGVQHVQVGVLTLGELLLVMSYLSQLYSPLKTISSKVTSLQSHLTSAERAFALLEVPPDVPERPDTLSIDRAKGRVEFIDVSFCYEDEHPVLRNISFEVPAGMRVGIAGKTGAGKTTLISLLTRFYDPTAGQILLDGIDLRDYKIADLRNQFAIVLQETVLFSTSIEENIAYARTRASEAEIIEASKAANAHEFILRLPAGYATQVGERGMRLSGGERQRIALARAFLKNAPILILDEPTSSVDMRTENDIMEAMERLMRGRTTFMIAHRLSTLKNCDLLLTLKDGQLIAVQSDVQRVVKKALKAGGIEDDLLHEKVV